MNEKDLKSNITFLESGVKRFKRYRFVLVSFMVLAIVSVFLTRLTLSTVIFMIVLIVLFGFGSWMSYIDEKTIKRLTNELEEKADATGNKS